MSINRTRSIRRRIVAVGLVAAVGGTLHACSEDRFDPAGAAERGIRDQILVELELESEVTCEEPTSLAVGTEFACHAEAEDGTAYDFVARILDDEIIGTRLA